MRAAATALILSLALVSFGCSPKRIPGTDIRDTSDTRAIVGVIDEYRQAAERRDAQAVMALVSKHYFDESGTPDPADDVDYQALSKRIADDYAHIASLRLNIGVKSVEVQDDKAHADVFYDEHYDVITKAGEVAKNASDDDRMRFVREGGTWRFVSGL